MFAEPTLSHLLHGIAFYSNNAKPNAAAPTAAPAVAIGWPTPLVADETIELTAALTLLDTELALDEASLLMLLKTDAAEPLVLPDAAAEADERADDAEDVMAATLLDAADCVE